MLTRRSKKDPPGALVAMLTIPAGIEVVKRIEMDPETKLGRLHVGFWATDTQDLADLIEAIRQLNEELQTK